MPPSSRLKKATPSPSRWSAAGGATGADTPRLRRLRTAVLNAGAPAPGMNTAVRSAVRLGIDKGHTILGVRGGLQGLIDGNIQEMNWMSVNGGAPGGGADLGTRRKIPAREERHFIC